MTSQEVIELFRNSKFSRHDLEAYASSTGAGRGAIEKDYVISILLLLISEMPDFHEYHKRMVFYGGTCIKKIFYPRETRFSVDLDFSNMPLKTCLSLFKLFKERLVGENLGVTNFTDVRLIRQQESGVDFKIQFNSLLGQSDHVVFNLFTTSPMKTPSLRHPYVKPYFQDQRPTIRVMAMQEILAEKTRALLQRHEPRDVLDVWFLMDQKRIKLDRELLHAKLKRSYEAAPPAKRDSLKNYTMSDVVSRIRESVTEKAWRNQLGGLLIKPRPDREQVIKRVEEILTKLGDIKIT